MSTHAGSPLGTVNGIHRMEFMLTDLNNHDLRALFQVDRQRLRDRLNIRWKFHRDPGAWDAPLPQSILARRQDGEQFVDSHTIGRIEPSGNPYEFTITPVPAAHEGHPDYYLPRLGRFYA